MKIYRNAFILFIFTLIFSVPVFSQTVEQSSTEELQKRLVQMETEMKAMREELDKLKQLISVNQPQAKPGANENLSTVAVKSETNVESTNETIRETKTESKAAPVAETKTQTKQTGVDIGSARLTPYGTIYFNAFGNSSGTNNADVPLFAAPSGKSNVSASIRQTRLGVRLEGARVGNARLSAILETDFFGGFPSVGIGENFGVVRLRLANARLDWEKTSVTVGQDWMVFAPVSPTSLAAAAIPQMAASGNNWARLPQIKIERKLNKNFTLAGAVLAPQTGDFSTNAAFFLQPTSGASSRVPFLQSRVSFSEANFFGTKKAGSIGVSAHYGRSRVFTGVGGNIENDIDSLGVALDWNFPLAERLSLSGEAFFGRNLGGFQAGVFQSYNNDFAYRSGTSLIAGGVRSLGTRGGWTQIGFTPDVLENRLGIYASIGVDDPRDEDLVSLSRRDFRSQNFSYAFDLIYKFTPQFSIGGEYRRMQTLYLLTGRRTADHYDLAAAYSF
jgi:hypothetical protein